MLTPFLASATHVLGVPVLPAFIGMFLLTVVLLLSVAWTGHKARRSLHLKLVVVTVASLAFTIFVAERLGRNYDLDAAGRIYPIHMFLAKTATASYLLPVVTGIATLRNQRFRRLHGRIALVVILLTVSAAVTGTWMILQAPPLAAQ